MVTKQMEHNLTPKESRHKLQFYVNALYQCIIRSFRKKMIEKNERNEITVLDANRAIHHSVLLGEGLAKTYHPYVRNFTITYAFE